ncbi:hypothetical protein KIN20_002814 [Parelaphostrongylus tenuis]|uniref:Lipid-binding serum glycoprotein C-terminal domain-containing protein n=1 Tax=Parelaphostrongylus tenuis TaxID=148309 RepID=A0AAD5LVS5_PARTN|nr:hypothetical protein KIN20_002814 [Parelaphostrongylus tenuis]
MRTGFVALDVFYVVVVVANLIQLVFSRQDFHPLLEASPNLPGVRLRLFPSGIAYLSKVASNVLAEQIPRIFIPDVEHRLPRDQGVIYITRMKISRFRRAESENVTTYAPNRISWLMKNLDLGFIGDLSGAVNIVVPFNLTGQAEIQAQGLSVLLDSAIESTPNGSAHVSTISCRATIRSVDVRNHNGGLFGLAVTVFKQGVSDNVRQLLQGLICKKVRKYLDGELNVKLAEVQTRTRLSEAIETNAIRSARVPLSLGGFTIDSLLGNSISTNFYIDFRLREPPQCDSNTVDLACAGEISYKGKGGTPFGPPAIAWHRVQSDRRMLMLQLSDYLPNSLLYHAHKQRLTRLHLTPSTPGISQFLRTTCESSFCIADLLPQLTDAYPNRNLELSIISSRAPAVLFSEKKGGVISVNLAGVIVIFVLEGFRKKQLVVLDVEVVADARLSLQQQNISGSVELTKFELTSRSAAMKITQEELSDISILVSQMLQNMLNEVLANGFPLPLPDVIRLHNVDVDVLSRRILIRTDISVDERRLSRIAARTIFNGPEFGRRLDSAALRQFIRLVSK